MSQKEQQKIYMEIAHDFSADVCPGAALTDLDDAAIEVFRKLWAKTSRLKRLNNLDKEQLLKDAGALTDGGVTYAALILFGTKEALRKYLAQAEVIFEYRMTESPGPANQREEFRQGFFAFYKKIWKLVNLRTNKQFYQEGFVMRDVFTFNERTVRGRGWI
jgi:ATP-dependent DNA helicase RecG